MDAHTPLNRTAVLLAAALLIAAAASAQTLSVNPSSVTFNACNYSSTQTVQVTSAAATAFTVSNPAGWFSVTPAGGTTPATLTIALRQSFFTSNQADVALKIGTTTDKTFTVYWSTTPCTVGGAFTVTATPAGTGANTMALATLSGSVTGSLALVNGTAGSVDYAVAASPSSWLAATPASGTIAAGNSASVTVTANAASLIAGNTYSGSLTITPTSNTAQVQATTINVSFAVGTSGGGGSGNLTLNGTGNSTISLPLTYTSDTAIPGPQQVTMQSASGAQSFNIASVTTSSGGNWLGAGGPSGVVAGPSGSYPVSGGVYVGLTSVAATLGAGTYSGSIGLTASDGSTAAINVTLTVNGGATGVTVSAGSYQFTAPSGSTTPLQAAFTASAGSGVSLGTPTATSDYNWLSITATGGASYYTIYANANPAGLADGSYNGSIAIPSTGPNGAGSTTISVTLVVGSGGGGASATGILPSSLSFFYQVNPAVVAGLTQLISVSGAQGALFSGATDKSWIQVYPTSVTAPANFSVMVNPNGLAAGTTYTGNVTITGANGTSKVVPVSLTVTASGTPVLEPFQTGDFVFAYQSGGATPAPQSVVVYTSDGTSPALSASTSTAWLMATSSGSTVQIGVVNPAALTTGAYAGTVTVTASGTYANSPLTIPVVLVVNGGGTPGPLTIGSLNVFSAAVNGATQTQNLSVSASNPTAFTATATSQSGTWLTISPNGTMVTNQTIVVSANPAGFAAGTYYGTISLVSGGVTQNITVTLQVGGSSGGTGNVTVTPASLSFSYQSGAQAPAAQPLNIANATQGTASIALAVAASTDSGGNWLSTSFQNGAVTPYALNVSVTPGTLAPGSYKGTVTITPTGGNAWAVPVTLTVVAAPAVSVSPATLSFSYQAGGQEPSPGSLQVTGNATGLTFTAQAATQSGGNWLSVTPASGTAPQALSVKVTPGSLDAGSYNGTVTVIGTNGATGSLTVNVTLTVTVPLPTIDKVVNAATGAAGPIAPGEIVSIFAPADGSHPIGPATPAQTKLDQNGNVATTLAGVQVKFSGYAAPLTYVGAGQINAVVPYEVKIVGSPSVQVTFLGQTSNAPSLAKAAVSPGLFTANGTGSGPGAILNQDGTYNSPGNPAPKGSTVVLYMTGEGETLPAGVTGKVTAVSSSGPLTPQPLLPVGVTVDGQPVTVAFYGEAPGLISGVMQLNVVIPSTARTGDLPVVVSMGGPAGGVSSQNGVTVSVK